MPDLFRVEAYSVGMTEIEDVFSDDSVAICAQPRSDSNWTPDQGDHIPSWSCAIEAQQTLDAFLFQVRNFGSLPKGRIGKLYEDYIGYRFEEKEWDVAYHGFMKGRRDGGIDVIARKPSQLVFIQCKCWGRSRLIEDWLILKFHRDSEAYAENSGEAPTKRIFISSAHPTDSALEMCTKTGVLFKHLSISGYWPMVKCNICLRTGNKRYYLPTEGGYHTTKITLGRGEMYAQDCREAERNGFRWNVKWR